MQVQQQYQRMNFNRQDSKEQNFGGTGISNMYDNTQMLQQYIQQEQSSKELGGYQEPHINPLATLVDSQAMIEGEMMEVGYQTELDSETL